jgi:hypothetical protein
MNALARIPLWTWFLFSVAYCYAIWNPYFSLYQLLGSDASASVKGIAVVSALIVASLYIVEGHRTLNLFGIVLFFALFGFVFWWAASNGIHGFNYIHLWGQWLVGLLMTVALQGGRIYRSLTGRVPVGTTITDSTIIDHHHG